MAGKLKPKGYMKWEAPYETKVTKKPTATPKPKPTKATGTRTVSRGR